MHLNRLGNIKFVCSKYLEQKIADNLDQALESTPAQSEGQNGVPNGEPQEQFRQDKTTVPNKSL